MRPGLFRRTSGSGSSPWVTQSRAGTQTLESLCSALSLFGLQSIKLEFIKHVSFAADERNEEYFCQLDSLLLFAFLRDLSVVPRPGA